MRVHPTLIKLSFIGGRSNELNAIFVKGDFVEYYVLRTRSGERPTASAIVSDIVDLSRTSFRRQKVFQQSHKPYSECTAYTHRGYKKPFLPALYDYG